MNDHLLNRAALVARFRNIRRARGMSVQHLADATGISRVSLSKLEMGKRDHLDVDEARLIADALGVELLAVLQPKPVELRLTVAD